MRYIYTVPEEMVDVDLYDTNCVYDGVILHDNVLSLDCSNNFVIELELNEKLKWLDCTHNDLIKLKLNENLTHLRCGDNHLTEIKLNNKLTDLVCRDNNNLKELTLNDSLRLLMCDFGVRIYNFRFDSRVELYFK